MGRFVLELPAGMLDDDKGDFVGTAVREVLILFISLSLNFNFSTHSIFIFSDSVSALVNYYPGF